MSEIGSDLVTAFVIKELTGPKRTLTLKQRALPYRPFTLEGEQRTNNEWYAGSPVSTMQVFGSKENETTISGAWKDAFLSNEIGVGAVATLSKETIEAGAGIDGTDATSTVDGALPTARQLAEAVDAIRCGGQKVEVTWLTHVRHGILKKFIQRWHTGHDVEWDMTFEWTSKGESLKDIMMKDANASNIGDLPNKVNDEVGSIFTDVSDLSSDVLSLFSSVSAELADLSDQLTDTVAAVGDVIQTPAEMARRTAGILDGIKLTANDLYEIMQDKADGASLDAASQVLAGSLELTWGEQLALRAAQRERATSAQRLRDMCAREQSALLNTMNGTQVAIFQARAGQDLRMVSLEAYGTADAWRGLMIYNGMTTGELRAGQVVFVPAQPPDGDC